MLIFYNKTGDADGSQKGAKRIPKPSAAMKDDASFLASLLVRLIFH